MAGTVLKRLLGRRAPNESRQLPFSLPGALHAGVRILFVDSDDLTDLLFVMPFIEAVREKVGGAHLGLLCTEHTGQLALSSGCFQDLVVFDPSQLKPRSPGQRQLLELLEQDPWELAILVGRRPDPLRDELAYSSGAVLRLGPGHPRAFPHINCEVRAQRDGRYPDRRTNTWGRLLGLPLDDTPLRWPLDEKLLRQSAQLVHFNKPRKDQLLVGLDPGVGKEGTLLSVENLAFLGNHVAGNVRSKTIVLTADENRGRLVDLEGRLRGELLDLPRPSIQEMILLLAQCDLFVGGNTDLFHFAAAMDVPALGIFTPEDREEWVPRQGRKVEILRSRPGQELDLSDLMGRIERLLG
jgi:ADP-heptose:LPS heptosyltransferase